MDKEVFLKVENIKKQFNEKSIHNGVSFELLKGESLGLFGGSGTGKSVLLRSLIGLEYIDDGKIFFKNKRIDNLTNEKSINKMRTQISYSFQSGALFDSLSILDNIAFPLHEHTDLSYEEIKSKVSEILNLIELPNIENLMPSDLSGGMKKRVGMARSIIMSPDIILYDEPTAGLDPANTLKVIQFMIKLKERGQSSIFVTHDIPSAMLFCDRIIILKEGKIVFNDTSEEFKKSENIEVKKFIKLEIEGEK